MMPSLKTKNPILHHLKYFPSVPSLQKWRTNSVSSDVLLSKLEVFVTLYSIHVHRMEYSTSQEQWPCQLLTA